MREKFHILVSGDDIPPPIPNFRVRPLSLPRAFSCSPTN